MMLFFDHFVDTRAKRKYLVQMIAITIVIYMVFTYVRLAKHLIFLETYEDLFALLQIPFIKQTFIARVILSCMALPEITIGGVCNGILISLRLLDILSLVCIVSLACFTNKKSQRIFQIVLLIWGLSIAISGMLAVSGLQANTLQMALTQVTYIGITFIIGGMSVMGILLYMLVRSARQYREALQYDAIEVR